MTFVKFFRDDSIISGFEIKGHSTVSANDETGKIVCSAVSSAAYMAANTITEIIGAKIESNVCDGYMSIRLTDSFEDCQTVLKGFCFHINQLAQQYKNYITVNSEV